MKVLILNSGKGTRMGELTSTHPKCMTYLQKDETILSRQLKIGFNNGVTDYIITTGYFDDVLIDYVYSLALPINIEFARNPSYDSTNYIYSIFRAKDKFDQEPVILMHGDLVFEESVFRDVVKHITSCGVVSSLKPLPEKDFKAEVINERIAKIGVDVFSNAIAFQPLYKLTGSDWASWLRMIDLYVEAGKVDCYAEEALNEILHQVTLVPFDVLDRLCEEVDNEKDLEIVKRKLERISI